MENIKSKKSLISGSSFVKEKSEQYKVNMTTNSNVKYALIGKPVEKTGLTRKALATILTGI